MAPPEPSEELCQQQEQQQASGLVEPWREAYLPQGKKEPDRVQCTRLEQSRPTGFFRNALRTYAGMLSTIHWRSLPGSLQQVIGDVDGMGTDLGVFLFIADLLVQSYRAVPSASEPSRYAARRVGKPLLLSRQHRIPALWYATDGARFGEGDLPPEPLVLSTNTFMDLPDGADFNWKEIRARSLAEHRAYLMQLDDAMRRDALVPTENRGSGRTETEVSLTAGPSFALLQTLATRKSSMFGTLLQQGCSLTGDAMDCGTSCR
ncbi:MAG: hypothetical protein EA413_02435 [Cyanobium sp. PLM2.Bin73]|nr:MAG: hypothetical protein EA413_02435 [Cyanobium sp. PLM2.Bin73]